MLLFDDLNAYRNQSLSSLVKDRKCSGGGKLWFGNFHKSETNVKTKEKTTQIYSTVYREINVYIVFTYKEYIALCIYSHLKTAFTNGDKCFFVRRQIKSHRQHTVEREDQIAITSSAVCQTQIHMSEEHVMHHRTLMQNDTNHSLWLGESRSHTLAESWTFMRKVQLSQKKDLKAARFIIAGFSLAIIVYADQANAVFEWVRENCNLS